MWKQVEKVDKVWKQVLVETQKLAVANIAISSLSWSGNANKQWSLVE